MTETLGSHLTGPCARTNGFDSIRLLAACAVIVSHGFALTYGSDAAEPLYRASNGQSTIGLTAVGIFFSVSGVLISMSFDRSRDIRIFAINRALRLFPGLWVCLGLTLFLLGPLLTHVPLKLYVTSQETLGFLGNAVFLPGSHGMAGMFPNHPLPNAVNGSLWTLKYEVTCYIAGTVMLSLGAGRRVLILAAWVVALGATRWLGHPSEHSGVQYHIAYLLWLFRFYGAGMILYLWRDKIPLSSRAGWVALALCVAAIWSHWFNEALALFGSYGLMVLAFHAWPGFRRLTAGADLSYGAYIYAYPLQQLFIPVSLTLGWPVLANIALALPVTLLIAWASWTWVESPCLRLKPRPPASGEPQKRPA